MRTDAEASEQLKEFYEAKNVLVTGGMGFVGSHITRELVKFGSHVTIIDLDTSPDRASLINDPLHGLREKIEVLQADVTDLEAMIDMIGHGEFHLIFHFAAYATVIERAVEAPYETIRSNTIGLVNVLEAVRRAHRPPNTVFFSSTDKVYGEMEEEAYQEEQTPLRGIGMYDATKLAADVFARTYHDVFQVPTVVLRMCNLFGPHDFNIDFRLVPKAMRNMFAEDEPLPPELYYDSLGHSRDYLYIEDAVRACLLLAYYPRCRGDVYNLAACEYISTPEMLKAIVDAAVAIEGTYDPARAEKILRNGISIHGSVHGSKLITIKNQHLNGDKIRRDTGFVPTHEFHESLKRTAEFYRLHFEQLRNRRETP